MIMDGLSFLLVLTANFVAFLLVIYSIAYMRAYPARHIFYVLFFAMLAGVNGVILAGDFLSMFIFLEIAALSAYGLVALRNEKKELAAALRYFIMGEVASLAILFAVALIYSRTETFNLAEAAKLLVLQPAKIKYVALFLFMVGFGTKAALVPLHSWLPDAHTTAPAPVSAMLSGIIIKVLGIYAAVRIIYNVLGMGAQASFMLMLLGSISILVGVLLALWQWDFKRLLAYHSISQVGYVVLGIGLGTPLGIMGGLFHLFNHALFKASLFLNAGAVEYKCGTRDLKQIKETVPRMPVTAITSLMASLSISGIPPFNGFWSKLFIILACVQAGKIGFALAAVIGSVLTLVSFLKVQKCCLYPMLIKAEGQVQDAPWQMLCPVVGLSLACLLTGIFSPYVVSVIINPAVMVLIK